MHEADSTAEIVALPTRWRSVALTTAYDVVVLVFVGIATEYLLGLVHGQSGGGPAFDLRPWLVVGLVVGLPGGLISSFRDRRVIRLTATDLEVPRFWRSGHARLPRAEVDAGASARRGRLDVLLGRDVIRGRGGHVLSIYRWSYSSCDVGRIKAALGIPMKVDDRGA